MGGWGAEYFLLQERQILCRHGGGGYTKLVGVMLVGGGGRLTPTCQEFTACKFTVNIP